MKKIYLSIFLTGLISVSCSDFLDEEPKSQMSTETFFTDRDHAYSAVNGLYRTGAPQLFDGSAYGGSPMMFVNHMSGFFDNQYKGQEVHVGYAQLLTLNGTNISGYLDDRWYDLYNGIGRANLAIKNLSRTPDLTETEMKQLEGEARFFRAFGYYFLVRMFGAVPLITEPAETLADELYIERAPVASVYDQIVADLKFCVGPSQMDSIKGMHGNAGRVSKASAATLLSEVYLTMSGFPLRDDHYAEAAEMANRVISGRYGAFSLTQHDMDGGVVDEENSAYNKIRRADVTDSEYILYHEYDPAISAGEYARWSVPGLLGLEDKVVKYSVVNGAYTPVDQFVWMYDPAQDLRIQEKQYFHTSLTTTGGTTFTFKTRLPYMWFDETALFQTGNSGKDVPIYTYADVLLIAAEATAHTTGVTAALPYLAQVRARAYWKKTLLEVTTDLTTKVGTDVNLFDQEVWTERNRELVFEFKTWFDVLRTHQYPQTTEANPGVVTYKDVETATNPWGKQYAAKFLLLPLSDAERQRNPALGDNNPGY